MRYYHVLLCLSEWCCCQKLRIIAGANSSSSWEAVGVACAMVELSASSGPAPAAQAAASGKAISRGELLARAAAAVAGGDDDAAAAAISDTGAPADEEATLASTFFAFTRKQHAFLDVSWLIKAPGYLCSVCTAI